MLFFAQLVIFVTAWNSPSETLAEAISILSTFSSSIRSLAIVNFSEGDYQRIVCGADINIEIDGWPATGRYAELSLQIHSDENTVRNITFTAANGSLKKSANFPSNVTIATLANPIIIKFWTHDSGATVFTEYKGIFV